MPNDTTSARAEDLASQADARSARDAYLRGRVATLRREYSAAETAKRLGLSSSTVKRWSRETAQ